MTTFHAICAGRDCAGLLHKTMRSILSQRVNGHGLIVHAIDDASTDATWSQLVGYVASQDPSPVRLYQNTEHMGAAYSRMQALRSDVVKNDDVCFLLGLDGDELAHSGVLERVWCEYEKGADFTYGSWEFVGGGTWPHEQYDEKTIADKSFRKAPWRCAPLQTFRARLVKDLPDEVFKAGGKWLPACTELALLFPAMERSQKMAWIPEILVLYNYHQKSTRRVYGVQKQVFDLAVRSSDSFA